MRRRQVFLYSILLIFVVAGSSVLGRRYFQPPEETAPRLVMVKVSRGEVSRTITSPGELVGTRQMELSFSVNGRIGELPVVAGQAVRAGQALARVGDAERFEAAVLEARLEALRAAQALAAIEQNAPLAASTAQQALVDAQIALDDAQRKRTALDYPRASDLTIREAEAQYNQAVASLAQAQKAYDDVAWMGPENNTTGEALSRLVGAQKQRDKALGLYNWYSGKPTDQDVAAADARLALAQAQYDQARQAWERVKDGPVKAELALAQADVEKAHFALKAAEADLDRLELRAPFDGIVLEVRVSQGAWVTAGQVLLVVADPRQVEVRATVVEEDYPRVQPGQMVEVYFDALPEAPVVGRVARIVPQRLPGDRPLYPVYIELKTLPAAIAPGMNADASIILESRADALRLPRSLVKASPDGSARVQVWQNGQPVEKVIQVGLRGDLYIEVLEGLSEGEEVIGQ